MFRLNQHRGAGNLRSQFLQFDKDRNGRVTSEEIFAGLCAIGVALSDDELQVMCTVDDGHSLHVTPGAHRSVRHRRGPSDRLPRVRTSDGGTSRGGLHGQFGDVLEGTSGSRGAITHSKWEGVLMAH